MARGPKKHLKRLNAPNHWMLDKLSGKFAPRPSTGPHKLRECLPLVIFLRNRMKYALTYDEAMRILKGRKVLVDGKARTDLTYPAGFMDVISMPLCGENFRLLYDAKGRYVCHKVKDAEAKYKLCKVTKVALQAKAVPYLVTHDGRTIRYPHPDIKVLDSVKLNIETGKIEDTITFDVGCQAFVTGGKNRGRIGIITQREKHNGGFDIVHIKDVRGNTFATRIGFVFVIGAGGSSKPLVTLPKGAGVSYNITEERDMRLKAKAKSA
jgi:small subunit ribosomal protein S4e